MNFSAAESQNYIEQMRHLIQRSQGLPSSHQMSLANSGDPFGSSTLAKLIRNGPFNGGSMTSVIQAPKSAARPFSPEQLNLTQGQVATNGNGKADFEGLLSRRHLIPDPLSSAGSAASNISPASSADHERDQDEQEHEQELDSPPAKVPTKQMAHAGGFAGAEEDMDDGVPPGTPKSEMSEQSGDGDYDTSKRSGSINNVNNLLHQQLLHRKGSLLQYCLSAPSGPVGLQGGSDAEADHTSTSPGSSDVADDAASAGPYNCQICDFTCATKFHFNSHMNTHCVHRCPVPDCNYSTRTEGRLRRHVINHHKNGGEDASANESFSDANEAPSMTGDLMSGASQNSSNSAPKKVREITCKHCREFVAKSRDEYYDHQRIHIKPEKLLECPLQGCRFVTEYKHHLEYHVRNHSGSKPFKCPNANCNYECVNKSMLNSHMKSHSNFYQFRCECGYATKYCHSLKQHLRKYQHKAINNGPESAQLSMASSPQPLQIIQAPSPKPSGGKTQKRRRVNGNTPAESSGGRESGMSGAGFPGFQMVSPNGAPSMGDGGVGSVGSSPVAAGFPYGLYAGVGGPLNPFQAASIYNNLLLSAAAANGMMPQMMLAGGFQPRQGMDSPDSGVKRESPSPSDNEHPSQAFQGVNSDGRRHNGVLRMLPQSRLSSRSSDVITSSGAPLDLSGGKENGSSERQSESPKSDASSGNQNGVSSSRRRRKGPAFKLDLAIRQRLQDSTLPEEDEMENGNVNGDTVVQPQSPSEGFGETKLKRPLSKMENNVDVNSKRLKSRDFTCDFCGMTFEDSTMYTMHMGFHGRGENPYACGLCGHEAADKVSFFLHIAKAPHY